MPHNDVNGLHWSFCQKGYNVKFFEVMHKATDNVVRPSQSNFYEKRVERDRPREPGQSRVLWAFLASIVLEKRLE